MLRSIKFIRRDYGNYIGLDRSEYVVTSLE